MKDRLTNWGALKRCLLGALLAPLAVTGIPGISTQLEDLAPYAQKASPNPGEGDHDAGEASGEASGDEKA